MEPHTTSILDWEVESERTTQYDEDYFSIFIAMRHQYFSFCALPYSLCECEVKRRLMKFVD